MRGRDRRPLANLLASVSTLVAAPPFASGDAKRPAADIIPTLVRRPWRHVRREPNRLRKAPHDAELHRIGILAKRLRYATEVSAPLAGKPARRAERALAHLQDVLGDHNDACGALTRLRDLTDDPSAPAVWAAGPLGGLQLARAADCRGRFPSIYRTALGNKHWTWIP